jgi:hypothetical protein
MSYLTDQDFLTIKQHATALRTKGYCVIADGQHFTWKRWCPALETELTGVRFSSPPRIYRNPLKEIVINFD